MYLSHIVDTLSELQIPHLGGFFYEGDEGFFGGNALMRGD